jgi:zinc transporter
MTEQSGFIYCYAMDGLGGGAPADPFDLPAPDARGAGYIWLHMDYMSPDVQGWMHERSCLDPLVRETLLEEDVRPRAQEFGKGLLVVVRGVNANPGHDPEDMVGLRIWVEPGRILTVRHRRVKAIEDVVDTIKRGKGPRDTLGFLLSVLDLVTDLISEEVSGIADQVDELEDAVLETESRELRATLSGIRRQSISIRRYIAPQRDVFGRLMAEAPSWAVGKGFAIHVRELADRTIRCVEDLDSARDRAAITHEELNSRIAEQMNRTMYILGLVAAIFLPLTFLTGLLGINVGGIPLAENPWGFAAVCAALGVVATLEYFIFRRKNWL